jgi:hypothetical protein
MPRKLLHPANDGQSSRDRSRSHFPLVYDDFISAQIFGQCDHLGFPDATGQEGQRRYQSRAVTWLYLSRDEILGASRPRPSVHPTGDLATQDASNL